MTLDQCMIFLHAEDNKLVVCAGLQCCIITIVKCVNFALACRKNGQNAIPMMMGEKIVYHMLLLKEPIEVTFIIVIFF